MTAAEKYARDLERLRAAINDWIRRECEHRTLDLRFHRWGDAVHIAAMAGPALDHLCASDDARKMLEWCDEQTAHQCTLLQAYSVLEQLELLPARKPRH